MGKSVKQKKKLTWLDRIEKAGNALPSPPIIFLILCAIVAVLSAVLAATGVSVEFTGLNRVTNEIEEMTVSVNSLLSREGIQFMFTTAITNFTSFVPLGAVLVAMLGVGIADGSGLLPTVLKKLVTSTPDRLVTFVVVFVAMFSCIASDAGYIIVIPLAAMIFMSLGRHPIAGIAAAFAGVAGGFGANIVFGPIDAMLAGITTEAARIIDPTYTVSINGNWFFGIASTILLAILGTIVTEKIVEPRLGEYKGSKEIDTAALTTTDEERKGLRYAGRAAILVIIGLVLLVGPSWAPLRGEAAGAQGVFDSPFMDSFDVIIAIFFAVIGIAYGLGKGSIKGDKDVVKLMTKSMESMAGFVVLAFFAAQFVAYFNYTNLGTIVAVGGANALINLGITGLPVLFMFMIVVMAVNFLMGSMGAKWAILAPVFVPMLMELGLTPEFIQAVYRAADSTTNVISPLMAYFALVVVFVQKYDKDAGMGTLISMMLPFTIIFTIGWTLLIIVWYLFAIPVGPGAGVFLTNFMGMIG